MLFFMKEVFPFHSIQYTGDLVDPFPDFMHQVSAWSDYYLI